MTTGDIKKKAYELFLADKPDEALSLVARVLNEAPDDITSLFRAGQILGAAHRYGMAAVFYRRALEIEPTAAGAWVNLGLCQFKSHDLDAAIESTIKALHYAGDDFDAYNNLLLMNTTKGDYRNALSLLRRALFHAASAEDRQTALANSALAHLALRHWQDGWPAFELMLGTLKQRKRRSFGVPDWDGQPVDGMIAVYGEQGLGDEIMFASIIPDVLAAGHRPVIECDPRLVTLYRRSFPCPVFGTRHEPLPGWVYDMPIKAKAAVGSLAALYRTSEPFPSGAYLKPARQPKIRRELDKLPGRKIGLAWTGGIHSTRAQDRSLTAELLAPLLALPGITWVSLEYKGDAMPGVVHWPGLTQSADYDDTAALVSELDGVVSVTTTVALLCGALGKPCDVLVPEHPTWHWAESGNMPWFDCLRLWRRDGVDWRPVIARLADSLIEPVRLAAQ